ncbi:MAG: hypothetical protein KDK33_06055, partial [Leptospiraceae bacterium]|nr:hypothetical protein [Leptospiraceae bacterium]
HQSARYGVLYTGFGYHFVPDAPVHPYMGGRIGFGVCEDLHGRNDPCRTWTYGANLGLEVDLGQAFVDLEFGADLLTLSIFRDSVQHDYPYLDNRITFRMGFVLGPGDTGHEMRSAPSDGS